jgi:hypothetical protein
MAGKDLLETRPVIIPNDAGALRVRRVMQRLIERESSAAVPPATPATPIPDIEPVDQMERGA